MRLDQASPHVVRLSVSRRNLLTLLGKLANPVSSRTLSIQSTHPKHTEAEPFMPVLVFLHAEPNDKHYDARPEVPGPMLMDASTVAQVAIDLLQQIEDGGVLDDFATATLNKTIHSAEYIRDQLDRNAKGVAIV